MEGQPIRRNDGASAGTTDVRAHLRAVAGPRLTGSEGAAACQVYLRDQLESFGYQVEDRPFRFNPWPGRIGVSLVGGLYLIGVFTAAAFLYGGSAYGAIALLLLVLVLAGAVAAFARPVMDRVPRMSIQGVNLLARMPDQRPKYLVLAHRDSKSQPVPLSFRGPAIVLGLVAWVALLAAAIASTVQPVPTPIILLIGIAAVSAGVILVFCWVDNHSPGALDNATGLAALLGIAERERAAGDVAFLITDGEELGLAGARAIAGHLPAVFGAINLDGLDDHGVFYVMERFGMGRKRGFAPHLAAALLRSADEHELEAQRRDLPFGILVDHIPLVNAGMTALTVMRGGLSSLRRVHRPTDDLAHTRGDGAAAAVLLVAGALARLREQEPAGERPTHPHEDLLRPGRGRTP